MCFDALPRSASALLIALALGVGSRAAAGQAVAAGPTKAESTRKGFDFRRPDPGEILPNPATGVGPPPQLQQYSPSATMDDTGGGTANTDVPTVAGDAAPAAAPPQPPVSGGAAPVSAPASEGAPAAAAATEAPSASPEPRAARDLQALFAAGIVRSGIAATPGYKADEGSPVDPAQRAADERRWARWADGLAASRAAWERRRSRQAGTGSDAIVAVVEPGHVTLLQAPGRVTGAFEHRGTSEQTSTGQ